METKNIHAKKKIVIIAVLVLLTAIIAFQFVPSSNTLSPDTYEFDAFRESIYELNSCIAVFAFFRESVDKHIPLPVAEIYLYLAIQKLNIFYSNLKQNKYYLIPSFLKERLKLSAIALLKEVVAYGVLAGYDIKNLSAMVNIDLGDLDEFCKIFIDYKLNNETVIKTRTDYILPDSPNKPAVNIIVESIAGSKYKILTLMRMITDNTRHAINNSMPAPGKMDASYAEKIARHIIATANHREEPISWLCYNQIDFAIFIADKLGIKAEHI